MRVRNPKKRRSEICGAAWASVMDEALRRHDDAPTVDEICSVMREIYPREWQGTLRPLLPLVAAGELSETEKRVAFLREAARERGLDPSLPVSQIKTIFARKVSLRYRYPGKLDDIPRTRLALQHAEA